MGLIENIPDGPVRSYPFLLAGAIIGFGLSPQGKKAQRQIRIAAFQILKDLVGHFQVGQAHPNDVFRVGKFEVTGLF